MPNQTMAQMLMQQRKNIEAQARALIEQAENENRDLSGEEFRQFEQLSDNMNSLRERSDRLVEFDNDQRSMDQALGAVGHRGPTRHDDEYSLTSQFRALANGEVRHLDYMPTKADNRLFTESRALSKGTASAGGNTVPTSFYGKLVEHMIESSTLMNGGATMFPTSTGENMEVPVTTTHGTAALVLEGGVIPQSDPVFAKRTLGAYKYGQLIYVPNELVTDTAVDLEGYLARAAGRACGNALGAHLITGTGSGQPAGITTLSSLGVTGGSGVVGKPTFDDLLNLFYSVIPPYRNSPNAAWLVKDSTIGYLRTIKDTTNRYLWENSAQAGVPDSLFGKPVLTDPTMPAIALSAKSVLFGDLSAYWVRVVNGIRFERSDDFKFDTDVVSFRCLLRGDGMLVDQSGAVKHFIGNAA
jgi:HK97 family phage major capsid protein